MCLIVKFLPWYLFIRDSSIPGTSYPLRQHSGNLWHWDILHLSGVSFNLSMAAQGNEHDIRVRDDHREMPRFEDCCLTMESGIEMSRSRVRFSGLRSSTLMM